MDRVSPLVSRAPAKINLDLRVGTRRPDGYHELRTVFQSLALHDEVALQAHDGPFHVACDEAGVPADPTNLAWRAAAALADRVGRSLDGLAMTLRKRVPVRAGLGGGSSDAAAALRLMAACWGLDPADPVLVRTAAALGADVPFFLVGGTALGTGRGDVVQPLADLPDHHVLIVLPPFGVSTAEAYGWFAESAGAAGAAEDGLDLEDAAGGAAPREVWDGLLPRLQNDLEPPVVARHPEIGAAVGLLRALGARAAMMSGSGAAAVGLFRDEAASVGAQAEAAPLAARRGWRLLPTRTLDRDAFVRACCPGLPSRT